MATSKPTIILPQLYEIKAERCKRNLFYFLKEFWSIVIKDDFAYNFHLEYICDEVQLIIDKYVLERKCHLTEDKWYEGITEDIKKNGIFNVPPGTTKSTIISRIVPAWLWSIDDTKSIIGDTIDAKNATEFATASKDIINSDKYKLYFPHVKIRHDVQAKTFYQSINGGIRYSLTTRGSNTGKHAHLIIDDDPMDYNTAQSPSEAKDCIEGFKSLQTRKKDKSKTAYILVMQRLSARDTTAHALKALKDDVRHICLPAESTYKNINPPAMEEYYKDGLLDPNRLSKEILQAMRMGLADDSKPISDIAYNIQFNQVSETVEGLLYSKLNLVDSLPENRNGVIRYSFTDVADTGSDYFCTWFCEVNQGKIYIYDAIYTQEPNAITSEKIKTKSDLHVSQINKMETNNQGSVFITMLQRMGMNVTGYTNTGNKEERINAFAQFISYLNFVEPNTQPYHTNEYNQAVKHLQAYPKEGKAEDGHDDAEDALTELIRYLYTNARYLFEIR